MSVVATLDRVAAERLTKRIHRAAAQVRVAVDELQDLVEEARTSEAHVALGYASWPAYLADVLGEQPLRLDRPERRELVAYLAGQGMSTRAIAPIVGAGQSTVSDDLAATDRIRSVERPTTVVSLDGRQRPASQPVRERGVEPSAAVDTTTGELLDEDPTHFEVDSPATSTASRRRPIRDVAFDVGFDLGKVLDRLERLAADDRLTRNAEQVAPHLRSHLLRAIQVCQDLDVNLTQESTR